MPTPTAPQVPRGRRADATRCRAAIDGPSRRGIDAALHEDVEGLLHRDERGDDHEVPHELGGSGHAYRFPEVEDALAAHRAAATASGVRAKAQ
jgi:hypothetical protein